jgi:hypothetical protein
VDSAGAEAALTFESVIAIRRPQPPTLR